MAEKASWPLTEKYLHGTYHDGEMVFRQRPGDLLQPLWGSQILFIVCGTEYKNLYHKKSKNRPNI
jgi:hypothetical protein